MMADQVVMFVQEMRGVEDGLVFVMLGEMTNEIAAADADEIAARVKGAENARPVAASFDVGVEVKLD